jgi:hypothetical protein
VLIAAGRSLLLFCVQAKRGKHSSKEVSVPRINDVSAPGQGARAKQYLPFLQRGGKLLGLVESVSSGEFEQCLYRACMGGDTSQQQRDMYAMCPTCSTISARAAWWQAVGLVQSVSSAEYEQNHQSSA